MSEPGSQAIRERMVTPPDQRRLLLMIVTAVLVVVSAMVMLDMGPETLLIAAVVSCAVSALWCVQSLSMTVAGHEPPLSTVAEPTRPAVDRRVRDLRSEIVFGRNPARDADRLHATLIELIDDQLRHAHGIDQACEPEKAAAILGPELTDFVQNPAASGAPTGGRDIARIVTLIERL